MLSIKKIQLDYLSHKTNALCFVPNQNLRQDVCAIYCHGYTACKTSILNWGSRCAENGITTILFDLPGHYLGSFNEVDNFENFKEETPKLFIRAFEYLKKELGFNKDALIILGGHSLGSLLSIHAVNNKYFNELKTLNILVGLGALPDNKKHLFQSSFFKNTLTIRRQLVSPAISPEIIFPWIQEQKTQTTCKNKKLHFITGENDIVVTVPGTEYIISRVKIDNEVTFSKIKNLPHHMPELAASHIIKYLKKVNIL